jgi:hypothetical protein
MKNLIKKILKEEFNDEFSWIRNVPLPEITDQNKFMVLVDILGVDEVFGDVTGFDDPDTDFQENEWKHYGIDTYTLNNGEEWAVGTHSEFDEALYEYWREYPDDVGLENIRYVQDYLKMSDYDRHLFANEEADNYVDYLDDEEIIERSNFTSYSALEEEIEELEQKQSELDDEIEDPEEYSKEWDKIQEKIKSLEKQKESLIEEAKEEIKSSEYDEWYECLQDPYRCLVRIHGFYSSVDDLLANNLIQFDKEKFVKDMVEKGRYGDLSNYDGQYYEKDDYIVIRLN